MMVTEQLQGAWEQPSNTIAVEAAEPNALQKAALLFAEKMAGFMEQNERLATLWRGGSKGTIGTGGPDQTGVTLQGDEETKLATDDGIRLLGKEDRPWMMEYGRFTPLLIKSMQDQQHKIEMLEAKINGLETILMCRDCVIVGPVFTPTALH